MSSSRQLAAIMFTDIVGYTVLMGQDEQRAFECLRKNREIQKPIIAQFSGRWIKELGDGVMATFNTVSDAVNAAVKIQVVCQAANDFQLRIGIHLGEVVFEGDDVFGDGVNIAARIQAVAKPGSVYVSESVHHNVVNKKDFKTNFVKEELLKNVERPVRIYEIIRDNDLPEINRSGQPFSKTLGNDTVKHEVFPAKHSGKRNAIAALLLFLLVAAGFFLYSIFNRIEKEEKGFEKSIAVLPFIDMTPQHDVEYLGDGLAEEIINSLTSIRELKVIGRTSSFQFKGEKLDLRAIGEKLAVGIILEGSIQKFEDHFRITAQLVRTVDNFQIWSERYDMEQTNIFKIQDNIAAMIVDKLQLTLSALEKKQIVKNEIIPEAYNLFLKGLYQYKAQKFNEAQDYMKKVIELDSTYAPAYAYLGLSKSWDIFHANRWQDTQAVNEALAFSQRSIELDPDLAEGYSSIGLIAWSLQNDFAKARIYFEKSIELNPAAALILNRYCYFLVWMGNFEKVSQLAKAAMRVDPVDFNSYTVLYFASLYSGRLDEAAGYLNERKRIFGQDRAVASMEVRLRFDQGSYKKVIQLCDSLKAKGESLQAYEVYLLAGAYFKLKQLKESKAMLKQLKSIKDPNGDVCYHTALAFAILHETDSCFTYLYKAYESHEKLFRTLKIEPALQELRTDPRYVKLYQDYGFDKY
ncbi:MAG: hypothetical protein OEV74_14260 [Cyclobacteriaceae bacterium]|nr:hypothetical protein [Cyclobacteriaceae bacterium]MDH4297444.1 hypothetical protein [Cyclobacteriaceae bacterium]MDH5251335.1 hypothetical protein [Cyclobacteriaceae bacterium]